MPNGNGLTPKQFWYALLVLGGGASASLIHDTVNPPRPDPFTGTQGSKLEKRIEKLEEFRVEHVLACQTKLEEIRLKLVVIENKLNHLEAE